ncbi:DUF6557 family protein [Fusibacter sp. 3D3]|uniref:DUF6557 family protein n=1 Tax=Fusibacter sp. 3D3 TaxID=1048380 RepID=UPI0008539C97|nr:DUF6557 family protein [Fusibacter sp. 3D3]GAU77054.1 hypothetical protein F3D3_1653 [Fusibacter sp. 3D3]
MNLKTLMMNTTKDAVLNELLILYPETDNEIESYEAVYDLIETLRLIPFDKFDIRIGLVDPSQSEDFEEGIDEEAYVVVSGHDEKQELHFALGFAKWEEWVNAPINVDETLQITDESIIAICLYEMTFYGFDEETIASELEGLENGLSSDMFH